MTEKDINAASAHYGEDSITALSGAEAIRKNAHVYLGSKSLDGAGHTLVELIGNAADEASSGYGSQIRVGFMDSPLEDVHEKGLFVQDFGRGLPLGFNEKEQTWNTILNLERTYAGGKYGQEGKTKAQMVASLTAQQRANFDPREYNYLMSIGMHGVGLAVSQLTSAWFHVESVRVVGTDDNGQVKKQRFTAQYKQGIAVSEGSVPLVEDVSSDTPTGTLIVWKPDYVEVFKTREVLTDQHVRALAQDMSVTLSIPLEFVASNGEVERFEFSSAQDYQAQFLKEDAFSSASNVVFTPSIDAVNHGWEPGDPRYGESVAVAQVVLGIAREDDGSQRNFFHNTLRVFEGSSTTKGVHETAVSRAVLSFFNNRERFPQTSSLRFKEDDFSSLLGVLVDSKFSETSYEGQTKKFVPNFTPNKPLYDLIYNLVYSVLDAEFARGKDSWVSRVYRAAVKIATDRESLVRSRELARELEKHEKENSDSRRSRGRVYPDKFAPCDQYNKGVVEGTELFIVEGDSAQTGVNSARDSVTQCTFAVRGKSLNAYKAPVASVISNAEFKDIISILGAGADLKVLGSDMPSFALKKLRFDRVVILSDADTDGKHIQNLLVAFFARYMKDLVRAGRLYIAHSPLYGVFPKIHHVPGVQENLYFYSLEEFTSWRTAFEKKHRVDLSKLVPEYYKGLGSMTPEALNESTMCEDRRMTRIMFNPDDDKVREVFEVMYGADTSLRQKHILSSMLPDSMESYDDLENFISLLKSDALEGVDGVVDETEVIKVSYNS